MGNVSTSIITRSISNLYTSVDINIFMNSECQLVGLLWNYLDTEYVKEAG